MKAETKEYIDEIVKEMFSNNLVAAALDGTNFYTATESLLRSYPRLLNQLDEYDMTVRGKSKDISVAPPAGSGVHDWTDVQDEALQARMRSYVRTEAQLENIERAMRQFEDNPYFIVIRMYYFNEDCDGNPIEQTGRPRTMEDIANELEAAEWGHARTAKTLSKKKNEIVRDMTVAMFGEAGAVSIEMFKARKAKADR